MLCVKYDMLILHIGHVQTLKTSSLSVSHAAAPSARLDCIQLYLVHRVQTVRRLAAETLARQTCVRSHGVKGQPGKGKDYLVNVFPHYLWFGLSVYPTWCEIVSLMESGDLLAPCFAPGSVNQGGGAVRGALPCYPAQ